MILAELDYYDPVADQVATLRLSDGDGYSHPSAPGYYEPRLLRAGRFTRSLGADGWGLCSMGWGEIEAAWGSPGLGDSLAWLVTRRCAFDGRRARLLLLDDESTPYSLAVPWWDGVTEQWGMGPEAITWWLRDPVAALDQAAASLLYAGGDTEHAGVEGEDALKDRPKPLLFAGAENLSPVLCNTALPAYQVSHRLAAQQAIAVTGAWDGGVPLVMGTQRADLATLLATAPATASTVDWVDAADGCYVRPGQVPARALTLTALEGGATADRYPGAVWRRLLLAAGVAAEKVSGADAAAVDAAVATTVSGLWVADGTTWRTLVDRAARAGGAACWCDPLGVWRLRRVAVPATPAALRLVGGEGPLGAGDVELVDFAWRTESGDRRWGVPPQKLTLAHAPNLTPQRESELGGDQTSPTDPVGGLERRAWLALSSRPAVATDAAVAARHLLAPELEQDCWLLDRTAAAAQAAARLAILVATARPAEAVLPLAPAVLAALDLGASIEVVHRALGADGLFLVDSLTVDPAAGTVTAGLRGA